MLLLVCGIAFAIQPSALTPGYRLGTAGVGTIKGQAKPQALPHRTFRLVRVRDPNVLGGGEITISQDSVVIWDTSASGDDGVTVTVTNISMDSRVAGVVKRAARQLSTDRQQYATQDVGDENWTWLQTYGPANVLSSTVIAVGDTVGPSSVTGECAPLNTSHIDDESTPTTWGLLGFAMDAKTTTPQSVVQVFIRTE